MEKGSKGRTGASPIALSASLSALLLLACLLAALTACASPRVLRDTRDGSRAPKYRVIAYAMGRTDFDRVGAAKLTHINYAFGLVSTNGEAFVRTNAPSHFAQLQALKARNPNLKIILSIGGWGADNFSDAALTDASREKFASSCLAILKRYALDGIDLDWEYPGQRGPGIKFRAEDKENFTAMLRELRRQLDALSDERKRAGADRYTLTIASAGGTNYFQHTEMDKLHAYLDWINIMTYDLYGVGTPPGHHAGLFAPAGVTPRRTTDSDVQDHLKAAIPAHKLVIGAAFYAKSWTNLTTIEPTITGGKFQRGFSYSILARDYLNKNGFQRRWDKAAQSAYLWNPETKTFISYEDSESLRAKSRYIKKLHLGGIMYWEHSEDPSETLLDALTKELH